MMQKHYSRLIVLWNKAGDPKTRKVSALISAFPEYCHTTEQMKGFLLQKIRKKYPSAQIRDHYWEDGQ